MFGKKKSANKTGSKVSSAETAKEMTNSTKQTMTSNSKSNASKSKCCK